MSITLTSKEVQESGTATPEESAQYVVTKKGPRQSSFQGRPLTMLQVNSSEDRNGDQFNRDENTSPLVISKDENRFKQNSSRNLDDFLKFSSEKPTSLKTDPCPAPVSSHKKHRKQPSQGQKIILSKANGTSATKIATGPKLASPTGKKGLIYTPRESADQPTFLNMHATQC